MDSLSAQAQQAVTALLQCHAVCTGAGATFLLESDKKGRPQHVRLLTDAAALALATADTLLRKSQFQSQFVQLCIAVCETCAQDGEKTEGLAECVEACRKAAGACSILDVPEKSEILAMASRLPPGPLRSEVYGKQA